MKKISRRFDVVPVAVVLQKARPIEDNDSAPEPPEKSVPAVNACRQSPSSLPRQGEGK
jgi:hypothetical protein